MLENVVFEEHYRDVDYTDKSVTGEFCQIVLVGRILRTVCTCCYGINAYICSLNIMVIETYWSLLIVSPVLFYREHKGSLSY